MTRDVADIFDSLRRTQQELGEAIARSLEADPLDLEVLARLHEISARNAQSARLIQILLPGPAHDGEMSDPLLEEIEGIVARLEEVEAGLAARLGRVDPE